MRLTRASSRCGRYSGAHIFIIDKHPPPGESEDHRLLILVGTPDQLTAAIEKIEATLDRARQELPSLPPRAAEGWRPKPSVGGDGVEWEQLPDGKRQRCDSGPLAAGSPESFQCVRRLRVLHAAPARAPPRVLPVARCALTVVLTGRYGVTDTSTMAVNCHNCGGSGHFARDCPHGRAPCHNCGQTGHFARDCPTVRVPFKADVCHGCGEIGHYIRDCPVPPPPPAIPTDGKLPAHLRPGLI